MKLTIENKKGKLYLMFNFIFAFLTLFFGIAYFIQFGHFGYVFSFLAMCFLLLFPYAWIKMLFVPTAIFVGILWLFFAFQLMAGNGYKPSFIFILSSLFMSFYSFYSISFYKRMETYYKKNTATARRSCILFCLVFLFFLAINYFSENSLYLNKIYLGMGVFQAFLLALIIASLSEKIKIK